MSDKPAWIHAFKPYGDSGITSCEIDDPDANLFRVHWRGSTYSTTSIDFDIRYKAEWVVIAICDGFEAGRKYAFSSLREFMGISSR